MGKVCGSRQREMLDGLILSDLHISKPSRNARLSFTLKYLSFSNAITEGLNCFDWSTSEYEYTDKRTGNIYKQNLGRSRVHPFITEQYYRWYPEGTKEVPKDINLTDECLLWWYIGDGCLYRKKSRPKYRRVYLATDSFSDNDRYFLMNGLREKLGDKGIGEERLEITISTNALVEFANILGTQSPVEDYQYKFDFGQYFDRDYKKKSYENRPLSAINKYRKEHKVRELIYKSKEEISHV